MNPEQEHLADLSVGNVLVIAPAGCGKTEAIAGRARAVLLRGDVVAPRTILSLTFSNKAKENLAQRMRTIVGAGWRQRLVVTNFHGLAARVIKAHGRVVGITEGVVFPEESWRRQVRADLGITYKNGDDFEEALRLAKAGPYDDDEVMTRLTKYGNCAAIAYEERLRSEDRLDYDDLLRHAARTLTVEGVSRLYRAHFGMTMVDEVQDMSLLQFEMVRAVGGDRVTYAGDPAQGIYSFAGADPVEVFKRIRALDPVVVEFNQSYRSAPAVLRAVNALAAQMGSTQLVCAEPTRWSDAGHVLSVERSDRAEEASALLVLIDKLAADPSVTIGIVGRRGSRANDLREAARRAGVTFEDWAMPTHVPAIVELLKHCVNEAASAQTLADDQLNRLGDLCRSQVDSADPEMLNDLAAALDVLRGMVDEGMSLRDAVRSCHSSAAPGAPVAPGVHVLTGHKGKGQEFDWVFVVGLEAGHIPDFRSHTDEAQAEELRILHVMVSRARYGVVVTFVRQDGWRATSPSPWLDVLRSVATHMNHE